MPRIDTNNIRKSGTSSSNTISQTIQNVSRGSVGQASDAKTSLTPGQLVQGEVIDLRQNEIKLLLGSSDTLSATLKDIHSLSIGDRASFKVLTANHANISLKLMNTMKTYNLADTVSKALTGAGLPVTERNSSAVEELLDARMSIDKQTIYRLLQYSSEHKDASMQTLVRLMQLELPVDELHVQNMEAYNRYESRLLPLLDNLRSDIADILSNPSLDDNVRHDINSSLLGLLSDHTDISQDATALSAYLNESQADNLLTVIRTYIQAHPTVAYLLSSDILNSDMRVSDLIGLVNNLITDEYRQSVSDNQSGNTASGNQSENTISGNQSENTISGNQSENTISGNQSENTISDNQSENTVSDSQSENTVSDSQSGNPASAGSSLNTQLSVMPEYHSLISALLENRWSVSPKQLTDDHNSPEKMLEKLERETAVLKAFERYSNHNPKESSSSGSSDSLRSNLSFMQTLNQVFPYIQLPIQLKGQTVHSELFVYARKKQLCTAPSDEVSVMLHLDMESLGPLDVRIEMTKSNISTKFYIDDALSEQLINENIYLLDRALAAKGYVLDTEVVNHKKGRNPLEEFLASDYPDHEIKRYTFDIRA